MWASRDGYMKDDVSINVLPTAGRWDRPLAKSVAAGLVLAFVVWRILGYFGVELITWAQVVAWFQP